MAERPLRERELDDIDDAALRRLIAVGETDLVERKRQPPGEGLGPSIASFANSGGGWLLVGVGDDGTLAGFSVPGRASPQDWLRSVVRPDVDPLPSFAAKAMTIDGVEVLVIRIHASEQTPHLHVRAGAIYVREHGGKQPIRSQAALLALTVRPEQAFQAAYDRMTTLPLVRYALTVPTPENRVNGETRVIDWLLTAGPLTIPGSFRGKALSQDTARATEVQVGELINAVGPPGAGGMELHPHGSGVVVIGRNLANRAELHVLLDAGGVCVVRHRARLTRGIAYLPALADDVLTPLLRLATRPLELSGATGTTHLHLNLHVQVTAKEQGWRASLDIGTAHANGELHSGAFVGGDVELPAQDDAISRVSEGWMRELARTAGLPWWES